MGNKTNYIDRDSHVQAHPKRLVKKGIPSISYFRGLAKTKDSQQDNNIKWVYVSKKE